MTQRNPTDRQLDRAGVAALLDVALSTVDKLRDRDRMPDPDGTIGRSPWWWRSTIVAWDRTRPRRGQHGPQPKRHTERITDGPTPAPAAKTHARRGAAQRPAADPKASRAKGRAAKTRVPRHLSVVPGGDQ